MHVVGDIIPFMFNKTMLVKVSYALTFIMFVETQGIIKANVFIPHVLLNKCSMKKYGRYNEC